MSAANMWKIRGLGSPMRWAAASDCGSGSPALAVTAGALRPGPDHEPQDASGCAPRDRDSGVPAPSPAIRTRAHRSAPPPGAAGTPRIRIRSGAEACEPPSILSLRLTPGPGSPTTFLGFAFAKKQLHARLPRIARHEITQE